MEKDLDETWRAEYLDRIPTKVLAGQILVHNRVLPPAPNAKPGRDGFYAFLLHPADRDRVGDNPHDLCQCGWLPQLGVHFIFPGDGIASPERDLRVEDLVGSTGTDQSAPQANASHIGFGLLTMSTGAAGGDAFVVDPDGRVCKLVWLTEDIINFEEVQPPELGYLWRSETIDSDLLSSVLPGLRTQWQTWRTARSD